MANRLSLDKILRNLPGTHNVYYQPPESIKMQYPAIKYSRTNINTKHADNSPYTLSHFYEITVIDKNPDSSLVESVAMLRGCRFDRHYIADGLNHDVFTINY